MAKITGQMDKQLSTKHYTVITKPATSSKSLMGLMPVHFTIESMNL